MSKPLRIFLLLWLALVAGTLSVEVWMQVFRHTSLCTTSSCDVVGEYVRFGEGNLIKLGAAFFWMLWGLVFFGGRYDKKWIWGLFALSLAGGLAFDGAILGFQFMGLKEQCLLCIGVGAGLAGALLLSAWLRRSVLALVVGVAVWCGGFAANTILDLNVIPPYLPTTAAVTYKAQNPQAAQHVLFFSMHCDHCSKILANLSINMPNIVGPWYLSSIDNSDEDLYRLATINASNATSDNPFLETLRVESLPEVDPVEIPESVRQAVHEARAYYKIKRFTGIPVLIVMERPGWEMVLMGEGNIMEYLRARGIVRQEIRFPSAPSKHEGNGTAG